MLRPITTSWAFAAALVTAPMGVAAEPPTAGPDGAPAAAPEAGPEVAPEAATDETIEIVDAAPPGAKASVGEEQLQRTGQQDVHKVLAAVAGVYLRDEDGYGLRPNIGMRGAAAERSAKVTLMEDGVLIAPAPYSAPAAYYFPLIARMSRVDVIKGPAAVQHGPATVGGAVDLITKPVPGASFATIDAAGGTDRYGKVIARAGLVEERAALVVEGAGLCSDGFKQLDGGGDTGFAKGDLQVTGRVTSSPSAHAYHTLEVRIGRANEGSRETYTGLSRADFEAAPQRRYAATADDDMAWTHWRFRISHRLELGNDLRVITDAYRNHLRRRWGKLDGFVGERDLAGILKAPDLGSNAVYMAILRGQADSSAPEEDLVYGVNTRRFASQGVQSRLSLERQTGAVRHHADAGVRIHFDRADRRRDEQFRTMVAGALTDSTRADARTVDSRGETLALAAFAQDRVYWRQLELGVGARIETLSQRYADHLAGTYTENSTTALIPGAGALVHVTDAVAVLAGVHRGFAPVAPSASDDVRPERSTNYEAGARLRLPWLAADVIGFVSNYQNLKGACTQSSGCDPSMEGDEFNGGAVRVMGVEAQAGLRPRLNRHLELPVDVAYTFTDSAFQTSFDSDFAGWGRVEEGDELPYLPAHQVNVQTALVARRWEVGVTAGWRGAQRDVPGTESLSDPAVRGADALFTLGAQVHVRPKASFDFYLTGDNLLNAQVVAGTRPYGVRPNSPRLLILGVRADI